MTSNKVLEINQENFVSWIQTNFPFVYPLFDFERRELIFERVDEFLGFASQSEDILTRFVVGVWLGSNRYNFDMIQAAKVLDPLHLTVISEFLRNPEWP